jgi:hypothetical protein
MRRNILFLHPHIPSWSQRLDSRYIRGRGCKIKLLFIFLNEILRNNLFLYLKKGPPTSTTCTRTCTQVQVVQVVGVQVLCSKVHIHIHVCTIGNRQ